MRCKYIIHGIKYGFIFLEDANAGGVTITNDADAVYAYIKNMDPSLRIVYKGTDGVWMELVEQLTWMGKGIGFVEWNGLAWDLLKRDHAL